MSAQSRTRTLTTAVGAQIVVDGRSYVNFGGSAYLGLASKPEIRAAGTAALLEYGSGAPIARSHRIATVPHQDVEAEAALFFGTASAMYLAGGYYFGLMAMTALRELFTTVFFDELVHYSLQDAIAASGLPAQPFRHLDVEDLASQLQRHLRPRERPLIATDGMYSTFGAIPRLDEMVRVVEPFGGRVLVDESHSFGVVGAGGRGVCEDYCLRAPAVLIGGSLGKAFGSCGGIVPADDEEIAAFRATPVGRGASAGLPAAAAMSEAALRYVRQHPELLARLRTNVSYMKKGLRGIGLDVGSSIAPVAAFEAPSGKVASLLRDELLAEGIFVYHSTYIGAGAAGVIRCGIFADHTTAHIDQLLSVLRRLL